MNQILRTSTSGHKALRQGRFSEPHRLYLITTTTMKREPIFSNWLVGRLVVKEMQQLSEIEHFVESKAWVLMPNHLHWLFALTEAKSLSALMQLLKRAFRASNKQIPESKKRRLG
jgi:REP element-mobilizing transposase RayT